MIISSYVASRVVKATALVLCVLAALFTGYSSARALAHAVDGLLPVGVIAELVGLQGLIALDVLVPIALYVGIVWVFSRLYRDGEVTAMLALRASPFRLLRGPLAVSLLTTILVAALSLFVRPWAYARLHAVSRFAAASLDIRDMHAGTFYVSDGGKRVIFAERRDGRDAPGQRVFIETEHGGKTRILYAMRAEPTCSSCPPGKSDIRLSDVHIYDLGKDATPETEALYAGRLLLDPRNRKVAPAEYSPLATSSVALAASHDAADIAEFQWRVVTPVSTLLLAILGIFFTRSRPRRQGSVWIGAVITLYFGYYVLCNAVRIWVQNSQIPASPGLWWMPALLGVVLIGTIFAPRLRGRMGIL